MIEGLSHVTIAATDVQAAVTDYAQLLQTDTGALPRRVMS